MKQLASSSECLAKPFSSARPKKFSLCIGFRRPCCATQNSKNPNLQGLSSSAGKDCGLLQPVAGKSPPCFLKHFALPPSPSFCFLTLLPLPLSRHRTLRHRLHLLVHPIWIRVFPWTSASTTSFLA